MTRPVLGYRQHRFADFGNLRARDHAEYPGGRFGRRCLNRFDFRVTISASNKSDMQHLRHRNIIGVATATMN